MANTYDPIAFTQRAVFGMDTNTGLDSSNDYNDHIRPLVGSPEPQAFEFDMLDYLENGAGRYAYPAIFPIIDKFFQSSTITPGTYLNDSQNNGAIPSIYSVLGITDDPTTPLKNEFTDSTNVSIWQYGTDVASSDFAERAYLFGTTDFRLDITNAAFTVNSDGSRSVSGMRVKALPDNFDFKGGSPINEIANFFLLPAYDPYGLIREAVPIKYTTSIQGREYPVYNGDFYENDNIKEALFVSVKDTTAGFAKLGVGLAALGDDIKDSATKSSDYLKNIDSNSFFRYERGNSKVIYGTPGSDNIGVFKDIDIEFYNDNSVRTASSFDVPNSPNLTNLLMVGGSGNDTITSYAVGDELLGGDDSDVLNGGGGSDTLNGGSQNDTLEGGTGEDRAVFTDKFEGYNYSKSPDGKIITFNHIRGLEAGVIDDGVDTLKDMEWGEFKGEQIPLGNARLASDPAPRIIPLPLEDGDLDTEAVKATDTTASPNINDLPTPPYVSLTAPVAMLDGNVDYTLNISPYKPNTLYNISYIFDTSASMNATELQQAKNAYTDLTNYFINNGLAENMNFSVISFSRNANLSANLTASQAISTIQGLSASTNPIEGTKYNDALYKGLQFFSQSPLKGTTNISYFVSDGRSQTNFADPSDVPYSQDAVNLRKVSNVQSFGIYDPLDPVGVTSTQINFVDSNTGVLVNSPSELSAELGKSGLAGTVTAVNIRVDDVVVDTIQPSELIDSPLGLTYEGSLEDLDVSANGKNVITAEAVFNNTTATTTAEFTVTAGAGKLTDASGNPLVEPPLGNDEDPFKRTRNGGDGNDDITLGYVDQGASGGLGDDYIVGNERDNQLDGGDGNDIIIGHEGNDTIITGAGTNKVTGGTGIDTVLYGNVAYPGVTSLRQAASSVLYNNSDTLTEVEYLQFSDVRISAKTLAVVPILNAADVSITEGDSGTKTAQFTFNLSSPAPTNVVFNYSTADIDAEAGTDYVAKSGQVTIPAGQTSASVSFTINGDTTYEANETFGLTLSGISGATFKDNVTEYNATVTIANDDPVNYPPFSSGIPNTITTTNAPNQSINLAQAFQDLEDTNLTYSVQNNTNSTLFDAVTVDQANKILLLE